MMGRRSLAGLGMALAGSARGEGGPSRIVSVGGALTETIFALGAGARVMAVDSTSRFPAACSALPQVGYMRALPTEGIVGMNPDLLLLSGDAGPPEVVQVLRAARMPIAQVADGAGADAPPGKARAVAAALGRDGEPLARALTADWAMLTGPLAAIRTRPRVVFVLSLARGAPLVSGRGTHADAMIAAAGGVNPVLDFEGYRPLSAEAAAILAPDVILMMDHALAEAGGPGAALNAPALAVTPAARSGRILAFDGAFLLNFGPRAAHARLALARAIHPGLALPELPERPWTAA
jgi:iron complex transport system substrate-binding protein